MTISSATRKAGPYSGTGAQTAFPFGFKVFAASDLLVVQTDSTGAEHVLSQGLDFTVALNADQNNNPGGTVTLSSALPAGQRVTVSSAVPTTQGQSIPNQGGFYPKVIELALDKLTVLVQQATDAASRGLRFALSDVNSPTALPTDTVRAGRFLAFDAVGNPTAASGTGADAALRTDLASSTSGSSLVGFLQSGPGAVKRTAQDKLRDSVSVKDFGAVGDGITNDTVAVQYALSALQTLGGGALHFPAGRYNVTAGVLSISGVKITVYGHGMDNTRIQSSTGTGAILTIAQNDFTAPIFVHDLSIITYTQETHIGLNIVGNAVDSQLNRVQARCEIRNVEVRGDNVATAGPQIGIEISSCHNLLFSKVYVAGRNDGSGTRAGMTHMTSGVQITGSASGIPSDFTIQGCYFYHSVYGVNLSGGIEGSNFMQCYAVACDYGFYSDQSSAGTRPWASIIGCHAAVFVAGVKLINVPQSTVAGCLLYKRGEANTLTTAVSLTNCDLSDVHDNTIYNTVTDYTVSGDFIGVALGGSSNYCSVHDNKMDRVQYGVNLVGTCQNTKTESNIVSTLFGSGTPQEYKNQSTGGGNTRLTNPRFENSQKNGGPIALNNAAATPLVLISPDTAEVGDEFIITALIHITKGATPGGVKAYLGKTGGTAVPVFQNSFAQANGYCYLDANTDGFIAMSTVMKIVTAGSLTLTLSAATNAGDAATAVNDAQISIVRR